MLRAFPLMTDGIALPRFKPDVFSDPEDPWRFHLLPAAAKLSISPDSLCMNGTRSADGKYCCASSCGTCLPR